jgi:acyl-CoA reductase-like NAD-dependent aldehyde dehydrogenase
MNDLAHTPASAEDWRRRAEKMAFEGRALIDGKLVRASGGESFECRSPIDGRVLCRVEACDGKDVDLAVAAARRAFTDRRWASKAPAERKRILQRFAALLRANLEELALLETLDMGKPIAASVAGDVNSAARCFDWYAESIDKIYDEIAPTPERDLALITREPLGVVAAIVPWNFPMVVAAWKCAPALAMGNSVVLKPAEQSPLTAIRMGQLALEAGIPEGVLNVVPGFGHQAGKALASHMDVNGVFFTGSTATGRLLLEYSAKSNLKKVGLELGGKSPNIILSSYSDIETAAITAADCMFANQGEVCIAPSRLIVERSIHRKVVDIIAEFAKGRQPANPLDPATRLGALVDNRHADRVMDYIESAVSEGARLVTGGHRALEETGGAYVAPTVFDNVSNNMRVAREEIFGPVLSVIPVDSAEEAVHVANDSPYGLAAAVWTDRLSEAHKVSKALHAGIVYVNCYDACDITTPFGGVKQSGSGRDKSLHALNEYTEVKTTWIRL